MRGIVRALLALTLAAGGSYAVGTVASSDTVETTDEVTLTDAPDGAEVTPSPDASHPTPAGRMFATAKQAWVRCAQDARSLHREGAAARRAAGDEVERFDPEASCGDKPHPRDFGLAGESHDVLGPEGDVDDHAEDPDDAGDPDDQADEHADGRGKGHADDRSAMDED